MGSQKRLVQRVERKLEQTVGDAFARIFGGSIVPQEVEALLRREAADGIQSLQGNRLLAPNEYIITLGVHDFEKLGADPELKSTGFARDLADYIQEQGCKRMVMWSSDSSSRRTCIPASSAPAALLTPTLRPTRRSSIAPGHNQTTRLAQNQE